MTSIGNFQPNWASAPGDTILDIMEERGISHGEFATSMGQTLQETTDLLKGRMAISMTVARKLEEVLGASLEFWMSRDYQYREDLARLGATDEEWVDSLPVRDMLKFGWLSPFIDPRGRVGACLRFFDVPTVSEWEDRYARLRGIALFRTSPTLASQTAAVAAWLRQGEREAEEIDCSPWDSQRFKETLTKIRSLTRWKNPARFLPELKSLCAECGVAVAIVRDPQGCRASGATRFLSQHKRLLQLSFRYMTDDHFWFTFFHEAGHLLLHETKDIFLEEPDLPLTSEEEEANEFAAAMLVPDEYQHEAENLRTDSRQVIRFAVRIGVSPGVVVGQLQHKGRIGHNQLNKLKRRFNWGQ